MRQFSSSSVFSSFSFFVSTLPPRSLDMAINLLLRLIYLFTMEEMWGNVTKRDLWIMTWLSLFLAAWCRFYINADVTVKLECLVDHWRCRCISQIHYEPELIKSDTKADTERSIRSLKTCENCKINSNIMFLFLNSQKRNISPFKHASNLHCLSIFHCEC